MGSLFLFVSNFFNEVSVVKINLKTTFRQRNRLDVLCQGRLCFLLPSLNIATSPVKFVHLFWRETEFEILTLANEN